MVAKETGAPMCTMHEFRVQGSLIGPDEATLIYGVCGSPEEHRFSWPVGPFDDLRDVYIEARKLLSEIHKNR